MRYGVFHAWLLAFSVVVVSGTCAAQPSPQGSPNVGPDTAMNALLELGQFAQALKAADDALTKNPADVTAALVKVRALEGLG